MDSKATIDGTIQQIGFEYGESSAGTDIFHLKLVFKKSYTAEAESARRKMEDMMSFRVRVTLELLAD